MVGVLKLVHFFIERLAEPVSSRLEKVAGRSTAFRTTCVRLAQWQHQFEYQKALRRHTRDSVGHEASADGWEDAVPELPEPRSEKDATAAGCDLLGEAFVWTVGIGILIHQEWQERQDEAQQQAQLDALAQTQRELRTSVEALEQRLAVEAAARHSSHRGLWSRLVSAH